ncbi:MAG: NAD+ synthase [Planctomycetota bacterium]|nr:MAG: NAD+ synthase [Planctomycetota bacterium]
MKIPPPPGCNVVLAERVLTAFLREETCKFGFERAVLGLSGGLDSAVVAELAVRALGGSNVLALAMPHATSSQASLELARASARHAGAMLEVVDITPMAEAHAAVTGIADDGPAARLRRGNICARTRMVVLYDRSVQWRGLVLGTSNKTELLLGYGTIYGDMACALNPLGDLYKSQVFALARHLGVPEPILERPPSADLWAGQTDEQDLGFTYAEADALLHLAVDRRYSREALLRAGFPEAFVERIKTMVRASQYKRMPPIIAKLANRTVNLDYRYPRDWGV